jgi:hypothetical protein
MDSFLLENVRCEVSGGDIGKAASDLGRRMSFKTLLRHVRLLPFVPERWRPAIVRTAFLIVARGRK